MVFFPGAVTLRKERVAEPHSPFASCLWRRRESRSQPSSLEGVPEREVSR